MGKDQADVTRKVERTAAQIGRSPDKYLASTQTIAGTVAQVTAALGAFKEAGAVHLTGYFADILWGDSLELFATEVMPALR